VAGGPDPEPGRGTLASGGPSLSVVVPTWNERERLPALLDSLGFFPGGARTDDVPDEVLITDGASTDGTRELARARGARTVTGARGRGAQLARGAREARGEVLWFLHADVVVRAGSVAALRRAFADRALRACGVRQCIDDGAPIYRLIERAANRRVRLGRVYGDSGLAVRREEYEAVGGFRPLPVFEDLDLSRRLRRRGRIRLVDGAEACVSSRRWAREGPLRRTVKNWILTGAYTLGVAPERLARYYRPHPHAAEKS